MIPINKHYASVCLIIIESITDYRIAGNFCGRIFRDLRVKVCEIIFSIFIFAISNEPTFELGDRIKR